MNTEQVARAIAAEAEESHNTMLDPIILSIILQSLMSCWNREAALERFKAMSPRQQDRHVRVAMKREYKKRKVEISEDELRCCAMLTVEAINNMEEEHVTACYEEVDA